MTKCDINVSQRRLDVSNEIPQQTRCDLCFDHSQKGGASSHSSTIRRIISLAQ